MNNQTGSGSFMRLSSSPYRQLGFSRLASAGLLIILFVLILGAGFIYQKDQKRISLLERDVSLMEDRLFVKNADNNAIKLELAKVSTSAAAQETLIQRGIAETDERLNKIAGRLNKLEDSSSQEWLLSEVEYLIKMADHRILMKEDLKSAIALLESAESIIKNMPVADSGLDKVRIAIIKDMTTLEAFESFDVAGTYAQLVALDSLIQTLPMVPSEVESVENPLDEAPLKPSTWLDKIKISLAEYLTIRRYSDKALESMLTDHQRTSLRDKLVLSLEQAEIAVLMGQQSIYDINLKKVHLGLMSHFKADDYQVKLAKVKLDELINVTIETQLPNLANSQQELKRYFSDRLRNDQI